MRLLIAAHYNLNNGDRAVLASTVKLIKEIDPDSEITVSAVEPSSMLSNGDFTTVGWPFDNKFASAVWLNINRLGFPEQLKKKISKLICNKKYLRELDKTDLVLISGGHHLTDILGLKSYYHLSSNFLLPIYMNKKVHILSQSIGPAANANVASDIKRILESAATVAYRDFSSEEFIKALNGKINAIEIPDLVFCLKPNQVVRDKDLVGVALYHSYSPERRSILDLTIPNLQKTIQYLLDQGKKVKIIPMDQGDNDYYEKIRAGLKDTAEISRFSMGKNTSQVQDTIDQFAEAGYVIAYKTHASVFSMISGTPLIGVAYHPKTIEFMQSMDLLDYAINDKEATFEALTAIIGKIEENYDDMVNKERIGVEKNENKIKEYLKHIIKT